MSRRCVRSCTALGITVVMLALGATPAFADPAGPTNYDSTVVGIFETDQDVPDPAVARRGQPVDGVRATTYGGDAFLRITVDPGVQVTVFGYDDTARDEYLLITRDGQVLVNNNSEARWLNEDRYALAPAPPGVGAEAPPAFEQVGSGGTWAWHDHRIHWMSTELPRTIDPSGDRQLVFPDGWAVPIEIDGRRAVIVGELAWLPPTTGVIPVAGVGAILVAGLFAGRSLRGRRATAGLMTLSALTASGAEWLGAPTGVPVAVVSSVFPAAVALLLSAGAVAVSGARANLLIAGASIAGLVWSIPRIPGLTAAVVPSALPTAVSQACITVVLGVATTALWSAIAALYRTPLTASDDAALNDA